jgi:Nucleotidyl transferase AbiEii toxin, Type IV TA system
MNLAEQIETFISKGFSEERAETIVLMREAAIVMFAAFPKVLLMVGGASLILFQSSVRHSADLDFAPMSGDLPSVEALTGVLTEGLQPLAKLLDLNPLSIKTLASGSDLTKLMVLGKDGKPLFTIDISGIGTAIKAGADAHTLEATAVGRTADVQSASRDQLLLQKAEAFLLRRVLKARDAYDLMLLLDRGAWFSGNLKEHLSDRLIGEFDSERIRERIERINATLCRADLKSILPEAIYRPLEESDFQPLRDALREIFADWL